MRTPDLPRPAHHETRRNKRLRRRVGAAIAGSLFLGACSGGPHATNLYSYTLDASNHLNQIVTLGPLRAGDLIPLKGSYRINGKEYVPDQLGADKPYLIALMPEDKQEEIFRRDRDKMVFSHQTIFIRGAYKEIATKTVPLGGVFVVSDIPSAA